MGMFDPGQYRGPQQSFFSTRLFLAIGIAIVAFIMYFAQNQENPVTGKTQFVSLSPAEEVKLGLASAPSMARKMGGEVPVSDKRAQEVQRIGKILTETTEAKKGPWKFQFHLLADTKTVNAFALPGGQIFITLGLYEKLQNAAQLAGVLSHEMGHVIERHSAQQMAKGQLGQLLVVAVGVGASDEQRSSQSAMMVATVVNQAIQLRYSRKDESEADIWGLKLMTEAGFDPRAMIAVMKILQATSGRGYTPEFLQSHPHPEHRIEQIEAYLKQHPRKDTNN